METKHIETASNLGELIDALQRIAEAADGTADTIYLGTSAPTYTFRLVERKLTDGSKFEDLIISHD